MENKRKKLFEVSGFTVYEDSKLLLGNISDDEVFEGFKQPKTVKFDGTPVSCSAPFFCTDKLNPDYGFYDLGFEIDSEHYKYVNSDAEKVEKIKNLEENLLKPYLKKVKSFHNRETNKHESLTKNILLGDEVFYDSYRFDVTAGITLLAKNIEDRFKIYLLLLKKVVCPIDMQDSSEFANASLTITDLVSKVKNTQSRSKSIADANYYATSLIKEGKYDTLCQYFTYLGIKHYLTKESDEVQFQDFIQNNIINSDKYRTAFIDIKENKSIEEVAIYSALTEAIKKSTSSFEKHGNVYVYKDEDLGSDLKIIAKDLSTTTQESKLDLVKELLMK